MYEVELWQWGAMFFGAVIIGLAKTGIAGVGILFVALFAIVLPSKQSVGVVLPLLICGDIVALFLYRKHARWIHLFRLFPSAAIGVVVGYLTMDRAGDATIARIIGLILLGLCCAQLLKRYRKSRGSEARDTDETITHSKTRPGVPPEGRDSRPATSGMPVEEGKSNLAGTSAGFGIDSKQIPIWYPVLMGALAGFTTMVSNAAGPIMIVYLLSMRLPKQEFMGTGAVFFLVLNLFKVPFGIDLGIINSESLSLNLQLLPGVLIGAALGWMVLGRISQRLFENVALFFTTLAAIRLLV